MKFKQGREFLKSEWPREKITGTDQLAEIPIPPFEEAFAEEDLIPLPDPKTANLKHRDLVEILDARRSRRKLGASSLTMVDLSFLLWTMQGVKKVTSNRIIRNVPSAGSRHPFESYFYADRVSGLQPGLYRYIGTKNAVLPVSFAETLRDDINTALRGQLFDCAVAMFWVCVPYRTEWRYIHLSHKMCAIDVGHIGQNAYLAAEALGIGCCVIGAYSQNEIDAALGLDGEDQFTCYIGVFGPYEE